MNILIANFYGYPTPTILEAPRDPCNKKWTTYGFQYRHYRPARDGAMKIRQSSETILSRPRNKMARAITGRHSLFRSEGRIFSGLYHFSSM